MKKKAIIIGAGIAGATTALSLSALGLEVVVIEALSYNETLDTSSNAICNMHPRFDAEFNKYTDFYLEAYLFGLSFYNNYPEHFIKSGMKIFPYKNNISKLRKISDILGPDICAIDYCGRHGEHLYLPKSGYLYIKKLSEFLLKDLNVLYNQRVLEIKQSRLGMWSVFNEHLEEIAFADYVVVANSSNAVTFFPYLAPYLNSIRGQSTSLKIDIDISDGDILCFQSISIVRNNHGQIYFGSTYERGRTSKELELKSQIQNIDNLCLYFKPSEGISTKPLSGYCGIRAVSTDYLPIVGKIEGMEGLYLNIGHGSRGVTSAPISGRIVADLITGRCESRFLKFLSPQRFIKA